MSDGNYRLPRFSRIAVQTLALAGAFVLLYLYHARIVLSFSPLLALLQLAAGAAGALLLVGAAVFAVSALAGRWFCGWLCPLGTLQQAVAWAGSKLEPHKGSRKIPRLLSLKYYLLLTLLPAAAFGISLVGAADPLALLVRGLGSLSRYAGIRSDEISVPSAALALDAGLLVILVAVSARWPRIWCRHLCPLGATLGTAALVSRVSIARDGQRCDGCSRCLPVCQHGCISGKEWLASECNYCLNCLMECPTNALSLSLGSKRSAGTGRFPQRSRRAFMTSLLAGIALPGLLKHRTREARGANPLLIRPPGALPEAEFVALCNRCGACMDSCPVSAIRPVLTEAGVEGAFTPRLDFASSYCLLDCVECGKACPTGAIELLPVAARRPDHPNPVRTGLAEVNKNTCIPWAHGKGCITCNEFCPTSPKAVILEPDKDGTERPLVVPKECIGCGACEFVCPVPVPAIRVTAANETRNPENRVTSEELSM